MELMISLIIDRINSHKGIMGGESLIHDNFVCTNNSMGLYQPLPYIK